MIEFMWNLIQFALYFRELCKINQTDVLLICGDVDRSYLFSQKKYAHLLDSVNELITDSGMRTITIVDPYGKIYGKKAFGEVFCINGLMVRASIKTAILRRLFPQKNNIESPIVNTWVKVIRKASPRVIIGIQPSYELCIAANKENIWIADLQHGILADNGYYGQNCRCEYNNNGWPDCILCWDEISAKWVKDNLGNSVEAKLIGNPWFLRFIEQAPFDKLVAEASKIIEHKSQAPVILVTLQWGHGESDEIHEIGTSKSLVNFIKNQGIGYTWWIRIHPAQLQETYRQNFLEKIGLEFKDLDNVTWEAPSEMPLPVILRSVDLHITLQSAVTIEAAWFGIKTAILDPNYELNHEYFGQQINMGLASLIPADEYNIQIWINEHLKNMQNSKIGNRLDSKLLKEFIQEIKQGVYNS